MMTDQQIEDTVQQLVKYRQENRVSAAFVIRMGIALGLRSAIKDAYVSGYEDGVQFVMKEIEAGVPMRTEEEEAAVQIEFAEQLEAATTSKSQ